MLRGRYLVLIEDDSLMGASLVQRLELEGAEVTWLRQAVRGIAAVRTPRRPVDAVICDIRLPDGDGEQIFATLAQRAPPPPFLFITGQGDIDQAVRLLKSGAGDYLTKPFDMADFLAPARPGAAARSRSGDAGRLRRLAAGARHRRKGRPPGRRRPSGADPRRAGAGQGAARARDPRLVRSPRRPLRHA
ncbi:MAG: hypothetical protein KatS3mg118_1229 [Paracoccaceae bacterium]|nr:MAG: hypothetical protein KatS3mg118_1229 [Paracoccaceae bacterium]